MFKFLVKTVFFLILVIVFFSSFIIVLDYIHNTKSNKETIYIWGDSQTYQGIDLEELHHLTNSKIYSAAKHGGGVYDFFVFTEKIPSNSTVILSISILSQLRPKYLDRNQSGISLISIKELFIHGYSIQELYNLILNNFKIYSIFDSKSNLFTNEDTVLYNYPISRFQKLFSKTPTYLSNKQAVFFNGISNLHQKKCEIIFVEFPLYSKVENIFNKSITASPIGNFKNKIIHSFQLKLKTIKLQTDKNLMFDLTHFNERGAKLATKEIYNNCLSSKDRNIQFLTIQIQ